MTTALAVILKKENLAWFLFCIGFAFAALPFLLDWVFGKDRPSYQQIEHMPSVDYKKLLLNSKSKRWIRLVDTWHSWTKKPARV